MVQEGVYYPSAPQKGRILILMEEEGRGEGSAMVNLQPRVTTINLNFKQFKINTKSPFILYGPYVEQR